MFLILPDCSLRALNMLNAEVMMMIGTFAFGAIGYPLLELATRRRTHYSMALAGGLSTMLIRRLSRTSMRRMTQAMLCGAGITAIEYACGRIWNRNYRVWDYRHMPLNLQGQVCLPYSLLWCGLSAAVLKAMSRHW